MDPWRTSIVDSRDGHIRIRGYDVPSLMTGRTFTDTIFLLHQGRLPSGTERALLDAILTGVADQAPAHRRARRRGSRCRGTVSPFRRPWPPAFWPSVMITAAPDLAAWR